MKHFLKKFAFHSLAIIIIITLHTQTHKSGNGKHIIHTVEQTDANVTSRLRLKLFID